MRRTTSSTVLLVALLGFVVAVPAALVTAGRATSVVPRPVDVLPPLPEVAGTVRLLADDLDDLPIASEALTATLATASVLDPAAAARAFDTVWASLTIPPGAEAAVAAFHDDVALSGAISYAFNPSDPTWAIAEAALGPLGGDPANIARLNDAAVALFMLGATGEATAEPPPLAGLAPDAPWSPMFATTGAVRLLQALDLYLPPDRSVRLNLGFLRSVVPDPNDSWFGVIAAVDSVLDADPADLTAQVLAASIGSRMATMPGASGATASLAPLTDDPATAALGWAATGDARLAEATIRAAEAPEQARIDARLALDAYDRALALVADPGVYAGRASALVALGALDEAAAAQRRAIQLAPGSVDLRADLAEIELARGDVESAREVVDEAIGRLLDGSWSPTMRRLRFPTGPGGFRIVGDRGFLGWSFGRERDRRPVDVQPQGGGIVVMDIVPPRVDPGTLHAWHTAFAPVALFELAMVTRIADGDAAGAESLAADWSRIVPMAADWSEHVAAAGIVHDGRLPASVPEGVAPTGALERAELALRAAGRDREAATLCSAVAAQPEPALVPPATAMECVGASEIRAGMPAEAVDHLVEADRLADQDDIVVRDPGVRLMAAGAAEAAGDTDEAVRLFRLAAGESPNAYGESLDPSGRILALVRLGDLALSGGNPIAALEDYDLARAAFVVDPPFFTSYWEGASKVLHERAIDQVLRNNRAVAFLQTLQPAPDQPPSCIGADRPACESAALAFGEAIASDPGRGVYHLNAGWVARLLGDDLTARRELAAAVALDTSLFPAWNDLGILMAQAGDADGAREAFLAALAADPEYPLARWNLGIAESRAGGPALVDGQASLAEAVRLDPTLRLAPLAFRHDERTYRFSFDPGAAVPPGTPIGRSYSIAAVLLGAAGTAAALVQLQGALAGDVVEGVTQTGRNAFERIGRRLRLSRRRRDWRARLGRMTVALPWLLTGAVLIALTVIQVAWASPEAAPAAIVFSMFAIATAVVVHALGHLVAARLLGGRVIPAGWLPGVAMSIVLAPFQVATGPFLAERTRVGAPARGAAWWIHAAGPLANAVYAAVVFALYVVWPMPALRVIVLMQLAAIGYTLLPVRPLDGDVIARSRPAVLLVAEIALTAVGAAFALGLL